MSCHTVEKRYIVHGESVKMMSEKIRTSLVLDKDVWDSFLEWIEKQKGGKIKKGDISREVQMALLSRQLTYVLGEQLLNERGLTLSFLAKKLDRHAVIEYLDILAENLAEFVAGIMKDKTPLEIAIYHKVVGEVLYGSEVEITQEENSIILNIKICNNLLKALDCIKILSKDEYCTACEKYFKILGKLLGINIKINHKELGCEILLLKSL